MATYALYTASYGSTYANDPVKIFEQGTYIPAIVMASATGGVLSTSGRAVLDSSGNLSVYLDSAKTWVVVPDYVNQGASASSSNTQETTQLLVKTAVQSLDTKTPTKGTATIANASPVSIASDQIVPVSFSGTVTPTDRSSKITTGGTAQSLMGTNASRKGWFIQNQSTGDLWFNELGTAVISASTPQSFRLVPGAYYESSMGGAPGTAISIIGATTGQAFIAREW